MPEPFKLIDPRPERQAIIDEIESAQAAVNRAIQRCKDADLMQRGGPIVPLDNAAAWLVQANRAARKK